MSTTATAAASIPPSLVPIRPLSDLSTDDVRYAGAKGANLGKLTRTGLPVPPGFVVGAPAYAAFRVRNGETPEWLAGAIGDAYEELVGRGGDAPVAVRSSANREDTASASFAGINATFLNTRGRDAVIDAVKRCWMSLSGAEAIYSREQHGLSEADMDIAVVVQRHIDSTRAGVMFTINPATGEQNHLVIEGVFGLGEAVLSGQVSPDRFIVDKQQSAVVLRSVRPKDLIVETAPGGGTTTRKLSAEESDRAVLSDDEVLRVAELGMAIEREYRAPQDIEWAFDPDGRVWMLQSRPSGAGR